MIQRTFTVEPDVIEFFTISFSNLARGNRLAASSISCHTSFDLLRTVFIGSFFLVISRHRLTLFGPNGLLLCMDCNRADVVLDIVPVEFDMSHKVFVTD